ncbi:MAG: hypothetical protein A3G34_14755 [Candidatus Lindowbacteria bacterium RIFCSPLOWO2_12_FULL_62_27]|nr:MAG: hypothetical protein A3I06_10035 [Candidatus Lindowbacteria bacterium RIFCSPLOWO2_02_FULL_62_12]OGH63116.1 MAG: hypothetical protein A3G34_14755 [Candidatus Lindowbacteria bacterium RIFCSPLOWO2_12_FULL_62_27]
MTVHRCEWCGVARAEMSDCPVETARGWLTDPFQKREAKFSACSDGCRAAAENFYKEYQTGVRTWVAGFAVLFGAAFLTLIPFGYPVFRWALPAAIGLGGLWMARTPCANSFRRDASGSLKTPLRRSIRDVRLAGLVFFAVGLVLCWLNTLLPPFLTAP